MEEEGLGICWVSSSKRKKMDKGISNSRVVKQIVVDLIKFGTFFSNIYYLGVKL